ncbi:MAG: diheme cytochrome c [Thiolinea sp.]
MKLTQLKSRKALKLPLVSILLVASVTTLAGLAFASGGKELGEREHYMRGEFPEHEEDEPGEDSRYLRAANANWKAECSECHMAYPPNMLPAEAWRSIMGNLDNHFGDDASLDEETVADILPFLEKYAASERYVKRDSQGEVVTRITETGWWQHEHDEISPLVWKRESIGSKANCAACHTTADKGNFDEDYVKIPKK